MKPSSYGMNRYELHLSFSLKMNCRTLWALIILWLGTTHTCQTNIKVKAEFLQRNLMFLCLCLVTDSLSPVFKDSWLCVSRCASSWSLFMRLYCRKRPVTFGYIYNVSTILFTIVLCIYSKYSENVYISVGFLLLIIWYCISACLAAFICIHVSIYILVLKCSCPYFHIYLKNLNESTYLTTVIPANYKVWKESNAAKAHIVIVDVLNIERCECV